MEYAFEKAIFDDGKHLNHLIDSLGDFALRIHKRHPEKFKEAVFAGESLKNLAIEAEKMSV